MPARIGPYLLRADCVSGYRVRSHIQLIRLGPAITVVILQLGLNGNRFSLIIACILGSICNVQSSAQLAVLILNIRSGILHTLYAGNGITTVVDLIMGLFCAGLRTVGNQRAAIHIRLPLTGSIPVGINHRVILNHTGHSQVAVHNRNIISIQPCLYHSVAYCVGGNGNIVTVNGAAAVCL